MNFNWMSASEHKKQITAKDAEIEGLKAKVAELEKDGKQAEGAEAIKKVGNLTALFGEEGKAANFDVEAAVKATLENFAALQTELEAAQKEMNAVAKHLGHTSADGVNLAEEVGKLEVVDRTRPVAGTPPASTQKVDEDIYCDFDEQLKKEMEANRISM